ncbi:TonB-dependent receptor plug domain-containing protein [Reichenbachiella versicolor]|uniref:TonB-dependent receptor plug domain-containing protein n=1 Tax=Reichenbachiella versicolor TaxID=1821036 RepID=UPI000D6DD712|nr:TonB-dependent receptor [Reichenbachiella versicolor]
MFYRKISVFLSLSLSLLFLFQTDSTAQSKEPKDDGFLDMSLEDLMNVSIVSASRESESLFDSPLSSYVITSAEISEMGATSIPDALRTCPGVLVRETSNGTYDVSIRGGVDGLPAYSFSYTNTSILVMINNRPVFSYYRGGTFWENLPVGLAEVQQIEVVYGPTAPLYGPNAVSGVINIITKDIRDQKNNVSGFVQTGTHINTGSVYAGKSVSDKLAVDLSVNYNFRTRPDERFYDDEVLEYVDLENHSIFSDDIEERVTWYPAPEKSVSAVASTAKIYYDVNEDISLRLTGGLNQSSAFNPLAISSATISTYINESQFIDLAGQFYDGTIQVSYLDGIQGLTGNGEENQADYYNLDIYGDYSFHLLEDDLTVRPAISFRSAYASDKAYTVDKGVDGIFNQEGTIDNFAGAVSFDYNPNNPFRVVLSGRYDDFSTSENGLFTYGAAVNYQISKNHIVRAFTGKSGNSVFIVPTFLNSEGDVTPEGAPTSTYVNLIGNPNLDVMTNTTYELGYRGNFTEWLSVDVTIFHQTFENFSMPIVQTPRVDESFNVDIDFIYSNLRLSANQIGTTLAFSLDLLDKKLILRPNVTVQRTDLKDYSPYYNVEGAWDRPDYSLEGHIDSVTDQKSEFIPDVWGGFNIIAKPINKLSIDLSGYYFGDHILHLQNEYSFQTGQVIDQPVSNIESKFTLNATINYSLGEGFRVFATGRNITDRTSPEGMGTDYLSSIYAVGIKLNY